MVTVFLSILNQMEIHLVQIERKILSLRSYPIQCERKWKHSFLSALQSVGEKCTFPKNLNYIARLRKNLHRDPIERSISVQFYCDVQRVPGVP